MPFTYETSTCSPPPTMQVFALAEQQDRVVVSADSDFSTILAIRAQSKPSLVLFRRGADPRPHAQLALLIDNLGELTGYLHAGSVVVIERGRIRIRPPPIGG